MVAMTAVLGILSSSGNEPRVGQCVADVTNGLFSLSLSFATHQELRGWVVNKVIPTFTCGVSRIIFKNLKGPLDIQDIQEPTSTIVYRLFAPSPPFSRSLRLFSLCFPEECGWMRGCLSLWIVVHLSTADQIEIESESKGHLQSLSFPGRMRIINLCKNVAFASPENDLGVRGRLVVCPCNHLTTSDHKWQGRRYRR
jgi:hypothetical protein